MPRCRSTDNGRTKKSPVRHADSQLRINLYMIAGTIFLHGTMVVLNELFFRRAEFLQGIGWTYVSAGTRLLCTLLFGWAGAVGLLITGWFACYWYRFPGDALRATAGSIAGALGPYLVYLIARREYGLLTSLKNPMPRRRLVCAAACALATPTLHHPCFMLHDDSHTLPGFFVMFVGDLAGSLIVLYAARAVLSLADRQFRAAQEPDKG